ncbi:hypothetical protein [Nonomuraea sp. NPDC002799]
MKPGVVAFGWGLIVTATVLLIPLASRDRLPDPLATHWGPGDGPDGSMSFTAYLLMVLLLWAVPWLIMLGLAAHGRALVFRNGRVTWWGFLFGWALLVVGMNVTTVAANLDQAVWTAARLSAWQVVAVLAVAFGGAALAGYLGRGVPDEAPAGGDVPPRLRLRPGQRTVWVSRVTNSGLSVLGIGALIALVAAGALSVAGALPSPTASALLPGLAIAAIAGLATMTLTVRAGHDGLAIGFGPFGWPARKIPLSKIASATSQVRRPSQVGGWGFRGLPGSATIMLRGGECLVLTYRSGGTLAISIDDAARGASLINALIAERVES